MTFFVISFHCSKVAGYSFAVVGATYYSFHPSPLIYFSCTVFCSGVSIGFDGPYLGPVADPQCMRESGILQTLEKMSNFYEFPFGLYGDPAYPASPFMYKPFGGTAQVSAAQRVFNYIGARMRVSVEWFFLDLQQYWATLCHFKLFRVHAMPIPRYMRAAVFFTNCIACHYPNRVEKYFNCAPPTLYCYFAIMRLPVQPVESYPNY